MTRFNVLMVGLILVLILAGIPVSAQTATTGARLLVAAPGGVTVTYAGLTTQLAVDWRATFGWSTGAGPLDFVRFSDLGSPGTGDGYFSHLNGTALNLSAGLGTVLAANTLVFAEATLFSPRLGADGARWDLVHTGVDGKQIAFPGLASATPAAAAVQLTGNRAMVGFPLSAGAGPFASIFDYPIRLIISNVCVK